MDKKYYEDFIDTLEAVDKHINKVAHADESASRLRFGVSCLVKLMDDYFKECIRDCEKKEAFLKEWEPNTINRDALGVPLEGEEKEEMTKRILEELDRRDFKAEDKDGG